MLKNLSIVILWLSLGLSWFACFQFYTRAEQYKQAVYDIHIKLTLHKQVLKTIMSDYDVNDLVNEKDFWKGGLTDSALWATLEPYASMYDHMIIYNNKFYDIGEGKIIDSALVEDFEGETRNSWKR